MQSIVFILLFSLGETLLDLPFSIYGTFVLEERHGFNKTTFGTFVGDLLKTLGLKFVLLPPILAAIIKTIRWGGDYFYVYVCLVLIIFQIVMQTVYPTLIAPLFNKFEPLKEGSLKKSIEKEAKDCEFPLKKIFVIDGSKRSSHSNVKINNRGDCKIHLMG